MAKPSKTKKLYDIDAEHSVLGSVIIDGKSIHLALSELELQDFYLERNRLIFKAMVELSEENTPIDLVTLTNKLESNGDLTDIGGAAFITDLINITPTSIHIVHYAKIVHEKAILRRLVEQAGDVVKQCYATDESGLDSEVIMSDAIASISGVMGDNRGKGLMIPDGFAESLIKSVMDVQHGKGFGLDIGITDLDRIIGGLINGELYILAGRPGMGKSSLALKIILYLVKYGRRVGLFSLEMSGETVIGRLAALDSQVSHRDIMDGKVQGDDLKRYIESAKRIGAMDNLVIDDTPSLKMSIIRSRAKREHAIYGLDVVFVDHFNIAKANITGTDTAMNNDIADQAQAMSKELNIPVVGLLQLTRSLESRTDKRPKMADLRGTGKWEENAGGIMFIYRDGYYEEETEYPNIAEITLAKNRHGMTGFISMY